MKIKEILWEEFQKVFGPGGDIRIFFAPGRVNLIGEHIDYNGGHVCPCALTIGTYAAVRKRDDRIMRFYSMNFEHAGVINLDLNRKILPDRKLEWVNYPAGVIGTFTERDMEPAYGLDILIRGNIPNSSGLSSSASLEILMAYILKKTYGFDVTAREMALIGQYSENNFNGVNCGIMDQFAIAMGRKDHVIFLDTATLSHEYVPVDLKDSILVIVCSNKKRGLGDSKYNERRSQCEEAVRRIRTVRDIAALAELTEEEFEEIRGVIGDPVLEKRAKHAVYENQRTLRAMEALRKNDIETLGRIMIDSDRSLREDYEVTGTELDTLVEQALKIDGVLGARMTGAGFGGCTVNIVKENMIPEFIDRVGNAYLKKIGYAADFYPVHIGDGPGEI